MEGESGVEQSTTTSRSYKPSQYTEATWETVSLVGAEADSSKVTKGFQVENFELLEASASEPDPMFSEFEASGAAGSSVGDDVPTVGAENVSDQSPLDENSTELEPSEEPQSGAANEAAQEAAIAAAREEGLALGKAELQVELEAIKAQFMEQFSALVEDLQVQSAELVQMHEQKAIELAFQVARRMVGEVVENQREYVVTTIQEGIRAASGAAIQVIKVSPRDYELLSGQGIAERIKSQAGQQVTFERDETIKAGCVITTSAGEVDFDLDKAWARLRDKVAQGPQS